MAVSPILSIPLTAPTQTDKTTTMNDGIVQLEGALQDQLVLDFSAGNITLTTTQFTRYQVFLCTNILDLNNNNKNGIQKERKIR